MSLVSESDLHIPTMTVRDTLAFAYKCNSTHPKAAHVDTILEILGLTHVAHTVVGGEGVRGISGGERRRVTVGEQWAANVRVFLADRLTDGLDSQAALDLIRALHVWCRTTDATVVLSLLQPPPEVYPYFDNVCILPDDRPGVLYAGPLAQAADFLVDLGYERPEAAAQAQRAGDPPKRRSVTGSSVLSLGVPRPVPVPVPRHTLEQQKGKKEPPPPPTPHTLLPFKSPGKNFLRHRCTVCSSWSCSGCESAFHIE